MASELRVNTLKDASGNNSIATSFVAGGSAKAWMKFNASSGTPSINDSLNFSSFTDEATGNHTISFSSSFGNANYAFPTGASVVGTDGRVAYNSNDAPATGSFRIVTANSSFSATDSTHCSVAFLGDLA
jgi:hypothetical protein